MCCNTICSELHMRRVDRLRRGGWAVAACVGALSVSSAMPARAAGTPIDHHAAVLANDNTRPAGTVEDGTVTVRLRAARGRWHPESDHGPSLIIDAFGEDEGPLTVPAPLIRVTEGTTIVVVVRNQLGVSLRIHGLCARNGRPCPPIDVPAGSLREARFVSGQAGTYHYWATSLGAPIPFRELAGALIVDPPDGAAAPDRIFVITEWSDLTATQLREILTADDVSEAFWARAAGLHVRDQRPVVAGDRAADIPTGGRRPMASPQPHVTSSPYASARVLFPGHANRRRCPRRAGRRRGRTRSRDGTAAIRRHGVSRVETGAPGQLAVPLPHHGACRSHAPIARSVVAGPLPPALDGRPAPHARGARPRHGRHGPGDLRASRRGCGADARCGGQLAPNRHGHRARSRARRGNGGGPPRERDRRRSVSDSAGTASGAAQGRASGDHRRQPSRRGDVDPLAWPRD